MVIAQLADLPRILQILFIPVIVPYVGPSIIVSEAAILWLFQKPRSIPRALLGSVCANVAAYLLEFAIVLLAIIDVPSTESIWLSVLLNCLVNFALVLGMLWLMRKWLHVRRLVLAAAVAAIAGYAVVAAEFWLLIFRGRA